MALFVYLQLRKIINACGNIISISLEIQIRFVLSETGIQADCEQLEKENSKRTCAENKEVSEISRGA